MGGAGLAPYWLVFALFVACIVVVLELVVAIVVIAGA